MMPFVRVTTLQWAAGAFCGMLGALMLVVPHQFNSRAYVALLPNLVWWGVIFLLGGALLVAAASLVRRRALVVLAHLLGAAAFLLLVWGFFFTQAWTGVSVYGTLGLLVGLAPFVRLPSRPHRDVFSLTMGLAALTTGGVLLALPDSFAGELYRMVLPLLPSFGWGFVLMGWLLLLSQFLARPPKVLFWGSHLGLAGLFWLWMFLTSWPTRALTGILFYGGFGLLLALLPWVGARLARVDPASLHTRLALVLAAAAALPLLLTTVLATEQEEALATQQALATQRNLAQTLAADVMDYLGFYQASVFALAAQPNILTMPVTTQADLLAAVAAVYPDAVAFATVDAEGNVIARSDDAPRSNIAQLRTFREAQALLEPTMSAYIDINLPHPYFTFGAPVVENGVFVGMVASAMESPRLSQLLSRVSDLEVTTVYLLDDTGRVLSHMDALSESLFADLSDRPEVQRVLTSAALDDAFVFLRNEGGALMVSYARLPAFGWTVVVERPRAFWLAPVRGGRETAFFLLLAGVGLALAVGVFAASSLTRPLRSLAGAAQALAGGEMATPLPDSGIREVAYLADAFASLRHDLHERTLERDHAEAELRELNRNLEGHVEERTAQLEAAVRELESFSYSVSHDLRAPLRGVDGFSQALLDDYGALLDERGQGYLERVRAGAQRMGFLIDDLLMLSRITRSDMEKGEVNLSHLAERIAEELREEQPTRAVSFIIPPDLSAEGDGRLLGLMLEKLLENSWKFTRKEPQACIEVGVQEAAERVFFVRDNGAGFDMQYADRLFSAFQRLHSPQDFEGTGIGLATVQRIINRHGGTIWAEGAEGQGATFYFTLP